MEFFKRFFLCIAALVISPFSGAGFAAAQGLEPSLTIELRVYNIAGVRPAELQRAMAHAAKAFEAIGLTVSWKDCTLGPSDREPDAFCDIPFLPTHIAIALQPQFSSTLRQVVGKSTLGYAVQPSDGSFGHNVAISLARCMAVAESAELPTDLVLGLAIAHEIGHLLLGSNSHSVSGLMRIIWERAELMEAAQGRLCFTPSEAQRIRLGVRARLEKEAARSHVTSRSPR